jgi:hypothetical protein
MKEWQIWFAFWIGKKCIAQAERPGQGLQQLLINIK